MLQIGFVYLVLSSLAQLVFFRSGNRRLQFRAQNELIPPEELTVLVPFRNEKKRILPLLESINQLAVYPKQIIFIDDHSEDNTEAFINKFLVDRVQFTVVHLASEFEGKKSALRFGVDKVETDYFITWDADCTIPKKYFVELPFLGTDLVVLPVVFDITSWKHAFMQFDVLVLNAFNWACSGWWRAIVSSGANLLIKRSTFLDVDKQRMDYHISSGDDMFLMKAYREAKISIEIGVSATNRIETASPENWLAYLQQRARWGKKSTAVNDWLANGVGLFFTLQLAVYSVLLGALMYQREYNLVIVVFTIRQVAQLLSYHTYFRRVNRSKLLVLLPIMELFWGVVFTLIFIQSKFRVMWKGRENKV